MIPITTQWHEKHGKNQAYNSTSILSKNGGYTVLHVLPRKDYIKWKQDPLGVKAHGLDWAKNTSQYNN